jgi:hypothetical protein
MNKGTATRSQGARKRRQTQEFCSTAHAPPGPRTAPGAALARGCRRRVRIAKVLYITQRIARGYPRPRGAWLRPSVRAGRSPPPASAQPEKDARSTAHQRRHCPCLTLIKHAITVVHQAVGPALRRASVLPLPAFPPRTETRSRYARAFRHFVDEDSFTGTPRQPRHPPGRKASPPRPAARPIRQRRALCATDTRARHRCGVRFSHEGRRAAFAAPAAVPQSLSGGRRPLDHRFPRGRRRRLPPAPCPTGGRHRPALAAGPLAGERTPSHLSPTDPQSAFRTHP